MQNEENPQKNNDFLEAISGCGCLIFFIWVFISIVIWAWKIHPIFGIIMFFILFPK
jgi:hypothetical protein